MLITHEYEAGGVFSEVARLDVSILHGRTWNKMKTMLLDVVSPKSGGYLLGPISDEIICKFEQSNF